MRTNSRVSLLFLFFALVTPLVANCQICPACVSVAVGDFNGDGKPDAAILTLNQNTVGIFINDGTGNLTAKQFLPVSGPPTSVVRADSISMATSTFW